MSFQPGTAADDDEDIALFGNDFAAGSLGDDVLGAGPILGGDDAPSLPHEGAADVPRLEEPAPAPFRGPVDGGHPAAMPFGMDQPGGPGVLAAGPPVARGIMNRELGFTAKARVSERDAAMERSRICRTNLISMPKGVSIPI